MYYRNQRRGRKFPSKGADVPSAGSAGGMRKGTVNWMQPGGPTQPRDRSLGMPRINTRMKQKGV